MKHESRSMNHGKNSHNSLFNIHNSSFYETINITNAKYKHDFTPINKTNLKKYTRAYLHHLFKTGEPLAMRLATLNNLDFYLSLMKDIRREIKNGKF